MQVPGITQSRIETCRNGGISLYNEDWWSQATWSQATLVQVSQAGGVADQKSSEVSQSPDPGQSSDLGPVPPNIRAIRDQIFRITEDVTWSAEQFNKY